MADHIFWDKNVDGSNFLGTTISGHQKIFGNNIFGVQKYLGHKFWSINNLRGHFLGGLPKRNGVHALWESEDPLWRTLYFSHISNLRCINAQL